MDVLGAIWAFLVRIWPGLRELLTVAAAITVAIYSVIGVTAWKRKLKHENRYQAAKDIIRGLYEFEEAFSNARRSWVPTGDSPLIPVDQKTHMKDLADRALKALAPGVTKLDSALLLARVYWPEKALQDRKTLNEKMNEFFRALVDYTHDPDNSSSDRLKQFGIIAQFREEDDEFGKGIRELVEKVAVEYRKILTS